MPSPAASVATQIWCVGAEVLLGPLPLVGIHAAVDLAGRVAPLFQMLAEVVQRVAVLGEDEQLAAAVLKFVELGPVRHSFRADSFESLAMVANAAGLGQQLLQRGDFGAGVGRVPCAAVNSSVSWSRVGVVEVVFVLFGVGHAALQLGQAAWRAGRRRVLQFFQQSPAASPDGGGWIRRWPSWNWPSRRWNTVRARAHAGSCVAAGLGQELVDVGRDGLVEVVFLPVEVEGDGVGVAVGKEPMAVQVPEVFLQPPERPGAIRARDGGCRGGSRPPAAPSRCGSGKGRGRSGGRSGRSGHRRRGAAWR